MKMTGFANKNNQMFHEIDLSLPLIRPDRYAELLKGAV